MTKPKVLVTGITGYLGSRICYDLLSSGVYNVRGTIRNLKNKKHLHLLNDSFNSYFQDLELAEADLENPKSLFQAINGCDYVIHVASPFKAKSEREFFMNPAVKGTNSVLEGCLDSGIKKLIVTSSIAAIRGFDNFTENFDESHWADPEHPFTNPYAASKTLAEKAIWDFQNNLPQESGLEIVSMNPGFIVGPTILSQKKEFESAEMLKSFFDNGIWNISNLCFSFVDIRDASLAHIKALEKGKSGERYILTNSPKGVFLNEIHRILAKEFQNTDYRIKVKNVPKILINFLSLFSSRAKSFKYLYNRRFNFDNQKAINELEMEFRDLESSVIEMAHNLIDIGYIQDKRKL